MEDKPRTTPYPLRMSEELRTKLEESAKSGARSLHAEIVARLEGSFASLEAKQGTVQDELLQMHVAQLSLALAGLNLAEMAAQFVELEVPTVKESMAFPKLQKAISAGRGALVHGTGSFDEAYKAATNTLANFKALADDLGITRIAAALKKTESFDVADCPSAICADQKAPTDH